jgi:hypothetical protein
VVVVSASSDDLDRCMPLFGDVETVALGLESFEAIDTDRELSVSRFLTTFGGLDACADFAKKFSRLATFLCTSPDDGGFVKTFVLVLLFRLLFAVVYVSFEDDVMDSDSHCDDKPSFADLSRTVLRFIFFPAFLMCGAPSSAVAFPAIFVPFWVSLSLYLSSKPSSCLDPR